MEGRALLSVTCLTLSPTLNPIQASFTLRMRWRDARYPTLPCSRLLPDLVALRTDDAADVGARKAAVSNQSSMLWSASLALEGDRMQSTL